MNKIVLITGATSGIGLGCARKFAENGDKLILTGRNVSRLEEIKKELIGKGTEVLTLVFDVRDKKEAEKQMNALPSEWQKIDVLVNNAGLGNNDRYKRQRFAHDDAPRCSWYGRT